MPWAGTTGVQRPGAGGEAPSCFTAHEKADGPAQLGGRGEQAKVLLEQGQPTGREYLRARRVKPWTQVLCL